MSTYKKILNANANTSTMLYELSEEDSILLKKTLLSIYDDIEYVCNKYKIDVVLIGGSALGAVRHNGFIPWDDDLDVAIERKSYDKFLKLFKKELGDKYDIMSPQVSSYVDNRFTQVYLKNSIYKSIGDNPNKIQGVYIDIFPIDYAPNNRAKRIIKGIYCNALMAIASSVTLYQYRTPLMKEYMSITLKSNFIYHIRLVLGFLFSWFSCKKWFVLLDKLIKEKNSDFCGILVDEGHYFKEIRPYDLYFPYSEGVFEGRKVKLPNDVNKYLSTAYGNDYMKIPPLEKRQRHFIIDMEIPNEEV